MRWVTGKKPHIIAEEALFYDCEFVQRDENYLSLRLCLVQLYQMSWPRVYLLETKEVPWQSILPTTLVMHHFEVDTQLLALHAENFPEQVLDTQLGFAFLQMQERISYADLVTHYLEVDLSKSETRSAWEKRPLTWGQKQYAAGDVYYLAHLYPCLREDLQKAGREEWWLEECQQQLQRIAQKRFEWFNLRHAPSLFNQDYAIRIASALTQARETMARDLRCHRNAILRDEEIIMLAQWQDEEKVLQALHDYAPLLRSEQESILALINEEAPQPIKRTRVLSDKETRWLDKAMQEIHHLGMDLNLAPKLLANKQDMVSWILEQPNRLETGWRAHLFAHWKRP